MIGQTISHYKILEKLGEGGMGVVYKARDTHLDRFVAIKVLPPEKVADPERKKRFVQEAKAASALNHPNIITIYDIDQGEGIDFIAMEYVDGRTLDELIGRKGLKLSEALKVSVQMADALAAAHEAGIVHRDLKPGNVMVTDKGQVKVLDFGLAKLTEALPQGADDATLTMKPSTEEGKILGTVAYMSPEQAEGKKLDARSDIFSFGSVLYEMVSGQKAFQGSSKMSTLSAILHQEPKPIGTIAGAIPADLEKLISRCLRKDPERRIRHMDDLKLALEDLKEESDSGTLTTATVAQPVRRRGVVWAMGLIALFCAVALAMWLARSTNKTPEAPLTAIPLTSYPGTERQPSFSPDGNQVAFSWDGEKQDNFDIYVKLIGAGGNLRLTTHPAEDYSPAWSPDGRFVAFLRNLPGGKAAVLIIPAIGGIERKLAEIVTPYALGVTSTNLTWSADANSLVVADKGSLSEPFGLYSLSIETGEKRRLTSPPDKSIGDSSPSYSPDSLTLALTRNVDVGISDLYLLSISAGLEPLGEPRRLTSGNRDTVNPVWAPSGQEIIFSSGYFNNRSLWKTATTGSGQPQRVASIGEDGSDVAISHRGNRLAYSRRIYDTNIWRLELPDPKAKPSQPAVFISSNRADGEPQFSPDGQKIAFTSDRSGSFEIWVCDRDGSNAIALTSFGGPRSTTPRWSPDGQNIAFDSTAGGQFDIYTINASGGKPRRLTTDPTNEGNPSWSHDGHWIYFDSNRTGAAQVWKMAPNGEHLVQVTKHGGFAPLESLDGKFLYYVKALLADSVWKVPIKGGEETEVFGSLSQYENMAVVNDGIYFVPTRGAAKASSIQFFNFATGKLRLIADLEKPASGGLTVSPDGRWVLYTQVDQLGSDLMLVENFK